MVGGLFALQMKIFHSFLALPQSDKHISAHFGKDSLRKEKCFLREAPDFPKKVAL